MFPALQLLCLAKCLHLRIVVQFLLQVVAALNHLRKKNLKGMPLSILSYHHRKTDVINAKQGYPVMTGLLYILDIGSFCSQSAANSYQQVSIKLM